MSTQRSRNECIGEVIDNLRTLKSLYGIFRCGEERSLYKQMAVTLRLLLTGSSGAKGLIIQVMPGCVLHPLARPMCGPVPDGVQVPASAIVWPEDGAPWLNKVGPRVVIPRHIVLNRWQFKPENFLFEGLLDYDVPPINVACWLETPILFDGMTIRKCISLIGSKDAAHFVKNSDVDRLKQNFQIQAPLVAALSDSVSTELLPQFEAHRSLLGLAKLRKTGAEENGSGSAPFSGV